MAYVTPDAASTQSSINVNLEHCSNTQLCSFTSPVSVSHCGADGEDDVDVDEDAVAVAEAGYKL